MKHHLSSCSPQASRVATGLLLAALLATTMVLIGATPGFADDSSGSATDSGSASSGDERLVDGETYLITNVDLDRYLASTAFGTLNNVITEDTASRRSVWQLVDNGDETWGLFNVATGGWLDADGRAQDWNVDQSENPGKDDRWRIVPLGNGEYELINDKLRGRLDADRGHQDWNVDLARSRRGDRKWMFGAAFDDTPCTAGSVRGLVASASRFDVDTTWARLTDAVDANPNLRIVSSIDHAAAAAGAGLELAPNRVLTFGNPALGTPLMQDQRSVALDLPQKMHLWATAEAVCVAFTAPSYLAETHDLSDLPQLGVIDGALRNLAGIATGRLVARVVPPGSRSFSSTESDNDFETTWTRLLAAIEASPANIAFTVDHAANSGGVLEPTRLVVFGNPNLGTPLIQLSPTIGIDLPLKMVVWETASTTSVEVLDVDGLAERHGIDPGSPLLTPLRNAVANFLQAATSPS